MRSGKQHMARARARNRSKIDEYIGARLAAGASSFVLCGGRRSGKTWGVLKFFLLTGACERIVVSVATMTQEQGRLGSHADAKEIISAHPVTFADYEVLESPREIRHRNGTRIFFNSYRDAETAKGIACDYLFINEANKFTKQQFIDLSVNVRRGVFIDYNPTNRFWVDDFFSDEEICHSTPYDNPYLTEAQRATFDKLTELAMRPGASEMDIRNYKVQVLGEYYDIVGGIFNPGNIRFAPLPATGLRNYMAYCDPSALCGNDYFACVLTATDGANIYVVDTISENTGTPYDMAVRLRDWAARYDLRTMFVETNGIIGIDFYTFAKKSGMPVRGWFSKGNKQERIVAKYGAITSQMFFADTEANRLFANQIYDFGEKCEHDDNVDALAASLTARAFLNI